MSARESNIFEGENLRSDLHELCSRMKSENNDWEVIRKWFARHTQSEADEAASYKGKDRTTALHVACRSFAPLDLLKYC